MRKGEREKGARSRSSFLFPAKSSSNLPHPTPSPPFEESVTGRRSSFCFRAPSISLIVSLSSHPPVASPYHPPPPFVPLFLCPSLALPGACLSGSVPVCLFADDSTWSRCDAQQLLLCSAASPPPTTTTTTNTPPYLSLPPLQCLLCSYLSTRLFIPCYAGALYSVLRSILSSLASLTNSLHFPASLMQPLTFKAY